MAMACAGCASSRPAETPVTRQLPEAPAFARPVVLPPHREGDDMLVVAGRERAGRARANDVIRCFVRWYRDVRAHYGNEQAEAQASATLKRCEAGNVP